MSNTMFSFQGKTSSQVDSQKQTPKYLEIWHSKGSHKPCQQRHKILAFSYIFFSLNGRFPEIFEWIEKKNRRKNYAFTENFLTMKSYGNACILCCEYVGQHLSSTFAEHHAGSVCYQTTCYGKLVKKCWLSFINLFITVEQY